MAGEKFSGPEGRDLKKRTEGDPWGELLERVETASEGGDDPANESTSTQDQSGFREGETQTSSHASLRLRIAIPLALSVFVAALVGIVHIAFVGEGAAPRPEAVPVAGHTRAGQARRATHTRHRPFGLRRPKRRRARRARFAAPTQARKHRTSPAARDREPLELVPAEPETSKAPSEAPSSGAPAPEQAPKPSGPAVPSPSGPRGEAGLVDGSRDSSEFGL